MNRFVCFPRLLSRLRYFLLPLSLATPLFASALALPVEQEEPVCAVKPKVELRKGPGKNHPVSWTVGRNMPFMKVGEAKDRQKNRWYEVKDLDGEKHWVRSSLVRRRGNCAVIRSKQAKLRQGPGKNFPEAELAMVDRYTPFRKLERDGEWLLLQDDFDGKYWVHETNVWMPMVRSNVKF